MLLSIARHLVLIYPPSALILARKSPVSRRFNITVLYYGTSRASTTMRLFYSAPRQILPKALSGPVSLRIWCLHILSAISYLYVLYDMEPPFFSNLIPFSSIALDSESLIEAP
jgi:hypothetical protein